MNQHTIQSCTFLNVVVCGLPCSFPRVHVPVARVRLLRGSSKCERPQRCAKFILARIEPGKTHIRRPETHATAGQSRCVDTTVRACCSQWSARARVPPAVCARGLQTADAQQPHASTEGPTTNTRRRHTTTTHEASTTHRVHTGRARGRCARRAAVCRPRVLALVAARSLCVGVPLSRRAARRPHHERRVRRQRRAMLTCSRHDVSRQDSRPPPPPLPSALSSVLSSRRRAASQATSRSQLVQRHARSSSGGGNTRG
jgi:hypothetical protein